VLVNDQDEALAFYTNAFGFRVIADQLLDNGFRALHVGPAGSDTGVWLMPAQTEEQRARVGRQTAGEPIGVLYTEDCRETVERLRANGVRIVSEPVDAGGSRFAHLHDLYGNAFVLVELPETGR
jgi:predicted enzyme related to lactoylglutathione lyase